MKRKITYITGTRADYGLMRSVLCQIHNHESLSLDIIVTGMHLMDEFGMTVDEIKKDGFNYHLVDVRYDDDTKESMALFIGEFVQRLTPLIRTINPDFILLLGDRGEMLAGAIVGAYLSIPVAHIHGGDISSTIDDSTRHAITKFAHIHFTGTEKSAERIIKMGEEPSRVHVVGNPSLDQILHTKLLEPLEVAQKYHLDLTKPIFLMVQHPVTLEVDSASQQITETLEALSFFDGQTIVIYPNADAGGRSMIEVIKKFEGKNNIVSYSSLPYLDYLSILQISSVLIGNSSSGIVEAPSFGVPALNIGTRQLGRERGYNVIDVGYDRRSIKSALERALTDEEFLQKVKLKKSPYGDGQCGKRIISTLSTIDVDNNLLMKKMTY